MMPQAMHRPFPSIFLFSLMLSTAWTLASADRAAAAESDAAGRLFEMRTYTTAPGKLENLHARFRDHTNALFVKHGMALIAYWVPEEKPNTLIYILAYPDRDAREASWKAFMADPEWQRVWDASKKAAGGPIVTKIDKTFMRPTDYSPIH
ncbi:MAG: NIPSNAP family protein [Pirellulales bacterium]|jgi:hypothetical protein|nr:NIPSNAP family protein [Pirellulales bacterium]